MAISFNKYIDITSGVGGTSNIGQRSLSGRIFTVNPLIPTNTIIEFTSAEDVGVYFGTTSEEYKRAANPYFSFISKNITAANLISYNFAPIVATAPRIFGDRSDKSLTALQFIATGAIKLTLGGVEHTLTGIDFTTALSLANVATILQAKINAESGAMWTAATVTYDATRKSFNLVGGVTGDANVSAGLAGAGQEILNLIGWGTPVGDGSGTIFSDGSAVTTITEILTESADQSDNFGSFLFTTSCALNLSQYTEAAQWTHLQNIKFKFMVPILPANTNTWHDALINYSGVVMSYLPTAYTGEYQEMADMTILAATNYNRLNATQNYMYQTNFPFTPTVSDTATSNTLDALRINYFGVSQTAGTQFAFWQRGYINGTSTAPSDSNTFANEQWLKSAASYELMNLMLVLPKISANTQGLTQVIAVLQNVINLGLRNGTISVGKPLNQSQKLFISNITNSETAWYQVQSIGYWLGAAIVQVGLDYEIQYTLIYSKDDVIRRIEGSHVLI